jgi:hypothetical protein
MNRINLSGPGHEGRWRRAVGLVGGLCALAAFGEANAGCASPGAIQAANGARFAPAVYHPGGAFFPVSLAAPASESRVASIVGLWKIEFLAKGNANGIPDGALIDFGTAIWFSDGTEMMISGGRQPANGDVCMGAWKQTGRNSFALNHIAMGYDGGAYVGPTSIEEAVTVDSSGMAFHGSFTITAHLATTVPGHEFDENTILQPTPIYGTITGTRVTAN